MSDFGTSLSFALRNEAEEIAMQVDLNHSREVLDSRLDDVEASRRRRYWIGGLVAVAGVLALVMALSGIARPQAGSVAPAAPPSATATPSPTAKDVRAFSSTDFDVPFTATLPTWVTNLEGVPTSSRSSALIWNWCPDGSNCVGLEFIRYDRVDPPAGLAAVPRLTYASYLRYLDDLDRAGVIEITSRKAIQVDGKAATELEIVAQQDGINQGCEAFCETFGGEGRYAVVDLGRGAPPLSIWSRTGGRPDWVAELDVVLATVDFR